MLSTFLKRTQDLQKYLSEHPAIGTAQTIMHFIGQVNAMNDELKYAIDTINDMSSGPDECGSSKDTVDLLSEKVIVDKDRNLSADYAHQDEDSLDYPRHRNSSPFADATQPGRVKVANGPPSLEKARANPFSRVPFSRGVRRRHSLWAVMTGAVLLSAILFANHHLTSPAATTPWTRAGNANETEPESPWAGLARIQDQFKPILLSSGTGMTALWDMDQIHKVTRDLKVLVQKTDLKSRDIVVPALQTIAQSAAKIGDKLLELDSKTARVSNTMAMINNHAIQALKEIQMQQHTIHGAIYNYFRPGQAREKLRQQLDTACNQLLRGADSLVDHGHAVQGSLSTQKDAFAVIKEALEADTEDNDTKTGEYMASLWTRVGGNKRQLDYYEDHKEILRQATIPANNAAERVDWTLRELKVIIAAIKDLRERLTDWVHTDEFALPIERHLEVVMDGAVRLNAVQEMVKQNREGAEDWVAHGHKFATI